MLFVVPPMSFTAATLRWIYSDWHQLCFDETRCTDKRSQGMMGYLSFVYSVHKQKIKKKQGISLWLNREYALQKLCFYYFLQLSTFLRMATSMWQRRLQDFPGHCGSLYIFFLLIWWHFDPHLFFKNSTCVLLLPYSIKHLKHEKCC